MEEPCQHPSSGVINYNFKEYIAGISFHFLSHDVVWFGIFTTMLTPYLQTVAPLGMSIDGFETFFERSKLPNFSVKTPNFYVY